ncbi:MAG TPA: hypothetical protein DCQ26_04285 [Marinilabiliales bacterium]|jgi:hypothetical protein|nr:MAG: hypothetical protein A2W95_03155 [Bacteroidetes bacterium GWA2_40_14]OFX61098.1 MAG: hypothetical protein A2W84_09640 [Bacteroidetes bacterium GWC2_40_13]OFX72702.1 MAG: hypothetical protein A2W96_18340 [Bacteroidetes bacterium GWD2_40_43]OFX91332.1 MAG: hypothetical protein A2W97_03760 [Bacteroidetes bacterium GWE2_40_63]OFY19402.1 MAG: hypothetical protein A2W88_01640 [Bacteroidetes bacterium GWF2_40_13]OFZ26054.1 MAG: hypothetical protein A2437_10765 [Bacteroidetes bacterium RIFOXYC
MKKHINIIWIFTVTLLIPACYEPLEKDLYEDYQPRLVIEGKISDQAPPFSVKVSYSAPPDSTVDFIPINEALIRIRDDSGYVETAEWSTNGTYVFNNLEAVYGYNYYLSVQIEGKIYKAEELLPVPPIVDTFLIQYKSDAIDGKGYYFKLLLKNETESVKYYKAEVSKNDSLFNGYDDLLVFDDSYSQGMLEWTAPYAFAKGDSVTIKLHSLSENMYKYYYDLTRQTANVFSNIQPPGLNPENNLTNECLGYFQASSITRIDTVLSNVSTATIE